MDFWYYFGLFLIGILIGSVATIGGIGGGPLVMPIFLLILQIFPDTAKGTSIFMIFISSGMATITHFKEEKIHIPSLLILAGFAGCGSLIYFATNRLINIPLTSFYIIFGVFELFIAGRYLWKGIYLFHNTKKKKKSLKTAMNESANNIDHQLSADDVSADLCIDKKSIAQNPTLKEHLRLFTRVSKKRSQWAIPFFIVSGFTSSFLGIGGGPINAPVLFELIKLPIYNATAASTTIIFFNSIVNVIMYAWRGDIDWIISIWMGGGMMLGSFIGAKFSSKIPRSWTLLLLSSLMAIAGLKLLFR